MDGPVNTIETYLKCTTPPDEPGAIINFATYQCAIYGFAMAHELKSIRYVFILFLKRNDPLFFQKNFFGDSSIKMTPSYTTKEYFLNLKVEQKYLFLIETY